MLWLGDGRTTVGGRLYPLVQENEYCRDCYARVTNPVPKLPTRHSRYQRLRYRPLDGGARRQGLARRFLAQLRQDRLQGSYARAELVTIAVDRVAEQAHQDFDVFVVQIVKGHNEPYGPAN